MKEIPFIIFKFIFLFCAFFWYHFESQIVHKVFSYIAVFCIGAEVMFLIQLLLM